MATNNTAGFGQIILVLQGGGALGAYQAGVYQALHEAGIEPDWVIGTSIGAINAALIAGNAPQDRVPRLRSFWQRVGYSLPANLLASYPGGGKMARLMTMMHGLDAFFVPNPTAMFGGDWPLAAENAGLYSTAPLRQTLAELIDFDVIAQHKTRISVGAANVGTAQMHYFDSRDIAFRLEHVLASGALPPAFPPVRIDGELYWDGGILSNTPLEAIFDTNPRRDSLIFSVHVWNPDGAEPRSIAEVLNRQKDVQYASRSRSQVARQQQIHRLRHVVAELTKLLPAEERARFEVRALADYGCLTRMHVVALLAPTLPDEDYAKDIDFSARGIRARWDAGYAQTARALAAAPWTATCDPLEGVILHQVAP
ncbi:MAG TPA: patatin-like phospholipase family protein [Acidocella sp.]|jgi:NTE family protein|uniref:patatin-like phospholipase family protein n=1 Tax=Acidocella sp. TaxID=50710 RepID=UPI002BEEF8E8|nr:patatin-like phospholipase family protein [Acidocella sp.]HVE22407.1 patatin-like phospholipase family protein [Acidocella sp.]